jgi:hypothetical protein
MSEHNPLLDKLKLPGRIFQLPSRGIFYKDGELTQSVKEAELHVQAMSAIDEINMKNPDQLFSGEAVNTVFRNCISGIEKPTHLLSKDVDAIMLFLRTVTYGPSFEFTAKHTCEGAKEHTYIADIDKIIQDMTFIDPTMVEEMYTIHLPNEQVVKIRPSTYQQTIDFVKKFQNKTEITAKDQEQNLIDVLLGVIESVDGIENKKLIEEWVRKLPSPMTTRVAKRIESINDWGSDATWKCVCRDCGETFSVELPTNPVSFFTE